MPEPLESPSVAVAMDINKELHRLNTDAQFVEGKQAYGVGWTDFRSDLPASAVTAQAYKMISQNPEVWYNQAAAHLMMTAASDSPRELEQRLLHAGAIISGWLTDLRSRAVDRV